MEENNNTTNQDWNTPENNPVQNWNTPENNPNPNQYPRSTKKVAAGITGILFGGLGIHKFILGYNVEGIILLATTLISIPLFCVIIGAITIYIPAIIGLIEGIIYLTKTDEEFYQTYELNQRKWF